MYTFFWDTLSLNIKQHLNSFLNSCFHIVFLKLLVTVDSFSTVFFSTFFFLCRLPPANVAIPRRLVSGLLNTFCCFYQPRQNQTQFYFHLYCKFFFSFYLKSFVGHTQLLFVAKLKQSFSFKISVVDSTFTQLISKP